MKKSASVFLSAFFIATVSSCVEQREWVDGADEYGVYQDTVVDNVPYRYYRGAWYRIHSNNVIHTAHYYAHQGGRRPVKSNKPLRMGGFGKTANHSAVHS